MPVDLGDQAELAALVGQEKKAREKLEAAREALALWVRRGKLAKERGEIYLAREAMKRGQEAKADLDTAQREINSLAMQKDVLKSGARRHGVQPSADAQALVEAFRMQGLAPEEQELTEMQRETEAELALGEMKKALKPGS